MSVYPLKISVYPLKDFVYTCKNVACVSVGTNVCKLWKKNCIYFIFYGNILIQNKKHLHIVWKFLFIL
jgi:hypothetical protein